MSTAKPAWLPPCAALTLALALANPIHAAIDFDPDGTGPAPPVQFAEIDLQPGNILMRDVIPALIEFAASGGANLVPFTTLHQSRIGGASDIDGNPLSLSGINTDWEVTAVARAQSVPFFFGPFPTGYFADVVNAPLPSDYVEMFSQRINGTPAADDLGGSGFNDGTRILAGKITGGFDSFGGDTSSLAALDQFGSDDYAGLMAPVGTDSFPGVIAKLTSVDSDYFPNVNLSENPLELVFMARGQHVFDQVNPSARFVDQGGTAEGASPILAGAGTFVNAGNPGELGTVNGSLTAGGTGMQFQFHSATIHLEEIRTIDNFSDGAAETFVQGLDPMRSREHFDVDGVRGIHRRTELSVAPGSTASGSFVVDPLNSATLTVDGNPGDTTKLTLKYLQFNPDLDLTDEGTLDSLQVLLDDNTASSDVPVTLTLKDSTFTSQSVTQFISPAQTSATFDYADFSALDLTEIADLSVMFELTASSPASIVIDSIVLLPVSAALSGDMDCDGDVDFDDIDDFVLGLNNPEAYEMLFGVPPSLKGDTDGDDDQDFDDIPGFVEILSSAATHAVPEPKSLALCLGVLLSLAVARRTRCYGDIDSRSLDGMDKRQGSEASRITFPPIIQFCSCGSPTRKDRNAEYRR